MDLVCSWRLMGCACKRVSGRCAPARLLVGRGGAYCSDAGPKHSPEGGVENTERGAGERRTGRGGDCSGGRQEHADAVAIALWPHRACSTGSSASLPRSPETAFAAASSRASASSRTPAWNTWRTTMLIPNLGKVRGPTPPRSRPSEASVRVTKLIGQANISRRRL